MHPQMPPPRPYPPLQMRPTYGPPPGWRPAAPYSVAISVLYLVAGPLPLITAVVWGDYLSTAWDALTSSNINGPGLVILLSLLSAGLLGLSCLSNGLVRLVSGKRWGAGAWSALTLAALALAGVFAMVALLASRDVPMVGQIVLYFVGTLLAVVVAFVGAFSRK